jgi:chromosomal replication initiation ATPase DnaA
MAGQLVFPFGIRPQLGRENFIAAPCNEDAFRFIESWPNWPARAAALHGPPGCGKTHLAKVWRAMSGAVDVPLYCLSRLSMPTDHEERIDHLNTQPLEEEIAALPKDAAVLLEDMDWRPPMEQRDRLLMTLFERPSTALLLTGRAPPTGWPVVIDDLRSRFDSLLAFPMWAPDDELLSGLARKHFHDRQLEVPDGVVARILRHVERTPEAIAAFIARADRKALSEKRAVSDRLIVDLIEAEEGK